MVTLHRHLGLPPVFGGVYGTHRFSFLCFVVFFACFLPVSSVPDTASVSIVHLLLPLRVSLNFI